MQNTGDATAYGSQTAYVLPVQGTNATSYLYLGDRWGNSFGKTVNDSRYVWLPLTFPSATSLSMAWSPELVIDSAAGTVTGNGGPFESLTARHSGKCADIPSASIIEGVSLKQYACNGGGNQKFWFKATGDGHVQLMARHSSLCLTDGSAGVSQETCSTAPAQQWKVTQNAAGYVTLTARVSGECLDVSDASVLDSARLITYACNTAANQQFKRTV
jgi:hypothetical protein